MEVEKVSAGQPIVIGEMTLLPITRTCLSCREVDSSFVCSGSKDLVGIVVVSPEGKRAINAAGEEVPLEDYLEQVPGIKELLEEMW